MFAGVDGLKMSLFRWGGGAWPGAISARSCRLALRSGIFNRLLFWLDYCRNHAILHSRATDLFRWQPSVFMRNSHYNRRTSKQNMSVEFPDFFRRAESPVGNRT